MKVMKKILTALMVCALVLTPSTFTQAATPDQNLLNTYGAKYGKVGTAVNFNQLQNSSTLSVIKQRYNSVTSENDMKPDALLGYSATTLTIAQAQAQGYYIPSNYTETTVPRINFTSLDQILQICYNNGLSYRAHTLIWHAQTPSWFFRTGYSANGGYVSQSVMTARMEMYIKTVMNHVYNGPYGSIVYAWDVVNEYLNSPSNSDWVKIYGPVSTSASFVRDAFRFAHETLSYYGLVGKVGLFYNDFNEYMNANKIVSLINYINSGTKYCSGVGTQAHLGTTFPSVSYYKAGLQTFVNAGLEIQITELDLGAPSESEQATYVYQIMKAINEIKQAGGKISGITWWGLSDDVSWRTDKPLLHSTLNSPKASYYRTLDAFTDVFGSGNGSVTTISNGWYYIKNINSNKYLHVTNEVGANGQNVEIRTGNGSNAQKWYLTNLSNGNITLTSKLGDYALDVAAAANTDGANINIYANYGGSAQQFKLSPGSVSGQFGITTAVSNFTKALDVYNFETSDGTNVCQWTYYSQSNQLWKFEPTN